MRWVIPLLIILFSFPVYGQSTEIEISPNTFQTTTSEDGEVLFDSGGQIYGEAGFTKSNVISGISTGWLSGGVLSINSGDNATFDVTAGSGLIVDASDPTNQSVTPITWSAQTGISLDYITTNVASFAAIDGNGNVVQSNTFPAGGNLRNYVQLGGFVHADNTVIDNISNFTSATPYQNAPDLTDLITAMGVVNISGNVISGSAVSALKFKKTEGRSFYFGIETKTDPVDPNNITLPVLNEPNVVFVWRDGSGGFNSKLTDTMITGRYDDGTGGTTQPNGVLPGGQWVNLRIKHSPDLNQIFLEFGRVKHPTSTAAINALKTASFASDPSLAGVPIRAYLTIDGGATSLSNPAAAIFTQTNKFGNL